MANIKGKAGHNIRILAFSRRCRAIYSFMGAGMIFYLPFAFGKFTTAILEPLATSNPNAVRTPVIPPIVYIACSIFAICLIAKGYFLWQRANHADQGAKGEEDIADVLRPLAKSGWKIEYGKRIGQGIGDIDILCISPKNKIYVIDVKSHKGNILTDGKRLYRRLGQKKYAFEKDFLAQVTKQALTVKKQLGADFVTPIIAFSSAHVSIARNKVKHVYVVEKASLPPLLIWTDRHQ